MNVVSWSWLAEELRAIEQSLDSSSVGDHTLIRLLTGFRNQIESHDSTGTPGDVRRRSSQEIAETEMSP
jgi:hypothetical protein